ncbi:GNAT family N-acetyltransferase [Evansella cellulosilytica]|uniref:GCN5-related N-acetyltransferase n=1 Tax=Evansella cellulosilytica (strain ATCC 21833 / DSM 2522 / FERM P-1141 / JCM 9156 / N-4) TaxID=649639 RepID=E6TWJ4_EVAC2|nr:GNAT family N-acetyltransferase [Evansella cellulosilytica]ADU32257.1 GCN5-related N-acetyltransferase [Evansella cellulosilytica DSM 2522]
MIFEADQHVREKLVPMFAKFDSTIVLSYLQGHMGKAWVNNVETPTVAQITVGIFVFYAGDPYAEGAEQLLHNLPEFPLVIVQSTEWKERIEKVHKDSFEKFQRYRFSKNREHLQRTHLEKIASQLPKEYKMQKVDKKVAEDPTFQELSEDFVSQFESIDDFINRGVGYAISHDDQVVSAATSYSIYNDGIEIEVATHPNFRKKGLATIVAAAIILDCLHRGKYASWDGANEESIHLAEKLGYIFKERYDTYYINV